MFLILMNFLEAKEKKKVFSDYHIAAGDSVKMDILVYNGDAVVEGFLNGDLTVYNGDIRIKEDGFVSGIVKSYAGKVYREGKVDEKSSFYVIRKIKEYVISFDLISGMMVEEKKDIENYAFDDEEKEKLVIEIGDDADETLTDFTRHHSFIDKRFLHYSKVEGLYLGLYPRIDLVETEVVDIDLDFVGGYAFRMRDWEYYTQQEFTFYDKFFMGSMQYDQVATEDKWKIDQGLNFLSTLFIHEDFYNYYRMNGVGLFAGMNFEMGGESHKSRLLFKVEYDRADIDSLKNKTNYALFGNSKDFKKNLRATEGELENLIFSSFYNNSIDLINTDYKFFGSYETTLSSGDYDYDKGIFSFHFKSLLPQKFSISNYLRLESSTTLSPNFKRTALGSIGTLPGYSFNSIGSDRDSRSYKWDTDVKGILANRVLLNSFVVGYDHTEDIQYRCIFDFGDAWYQDSDNLTRGFEDLGIDDLKSSFGVGVSFKEVVMVSVHRRLDTSHEPFQVQGSVVINIDDFIR